VSVTGGASPPAPTGFVDFNVCGPAMASRAATPAERRPDINLNTATVSGNDYTVTSDAFTPTSAGDYCFYAEYPADQGSREDAPLASAARPQRRHVTRPSVLP